MNGRFQYFLGLDGGGSGCRAMLVDAGGRVIGRGQGGPANVHSDPEGALAALTLACDQALGDSIPAQNVAAVLRLAGAEMSGARDWLTPRLPFGAAQVVQDAVTSTAGALGDQDGIVAALGTGSVFSRQSGGAVLVIGGRGWVLGDEAGGAWLGRRLLASTLRAADGIAPMTPLACATLNRLGGVAGIIGFAATARAADFAAQLADMLADPGDPLASAILTEADSQIAAYIDRLSGGNRMPVAFTGGLGPLFQDRLRDRWPVVPAQGNALDGAVALARRLARTKTEEAGNDR